MSDVLEISRSAILRRVLAASSTRRFSSALATDAAEVILTDRVVAPETAELMLNVEPSSLSLKDACLEILGPGFEDEELAPHRGMGAEDVRGGVFAPVVDPAGDTPWLDWEVGEESILMAAPGAIRTVLGVIPRILLLPPSPSTLEEGLLPLTVILGPPLSKLGGKACRPVDPIRMPPLTVA